jgi:hypothetical protein
LLAMSGKTNLEDAFVALTDIAGSAANEAGK